MQREELHLLKCNLHTHFFESYGNDPRRMIDAHHDAGYDCVALTEHCGYLEDLDVARDAVAYSEETYGPDLIVIVGEELNFRVTHKGQSYGMDMIGLFLDRYIYCGDTRGIDPDPSGFVTAAEALDNVHSQGGIGIIAHDNYTSWLGRREQNRVRAWDFRGNWALDGWEVGNGLVYDQHDESGTDLMLSHPQESVDEGYIVVANSDAHSTEDVERCGICSTLVFAAERTAEGVREALLNRRAVADCNGHLYGRREWVDLLRSSER
jgi:hypothetical protein